MLGVKRSKFAKEVNRYMAMYHVGYRDLAWIMGYRWSHWLSSPDWCPDVGWFDDRYDEQFKEPTDPTRQQEILDLIKNAQDNPEYWRRKYAELKVTSQILNKGILREKWWTKYYRDLYLKYYFQSLPGIWMSLRHYFWVYKSKLYKKLKLI